MSFMPVADVVFRICDTNGTIYRPYSFHTYGPTWTKEEMEAMRKAIDPHVPEKVDAMFNNWEFTKHAINNFTAKRSTCEFGIMCASTVQQLAEQITNYYSKRTPK